MPTTSLHHPHQKLSSPTITTMTPQTTQIRRSRPGQVQTNLPVQPQVGTVPASAISASSVASSSQRGSPIMSADASVLTTSSSLQPSPEPLRGRDSGDVFPSATFQLPESILTRKTSNHSLGTPLLGATSPTGAMKGAIGGKQQGLMRRMSNRAAQTFASRRRQSSVHTNSRDGSVGPGFLRRRSDSNNTQPDFSNAVTTDSDDDVEDKEGLPFLLDGLARESTVLSSSASVTSSSSEKLDKAGPSFPLQLLKGTWIRKVSKKNQKKRFILVLEPDAAKISWDRARPEKCLYIDDIKEIRYGSDIRQYWVDFSISESEESRWFTIIYTLPEARSKTKMMHLIADDYDTLCNWVTTLNAISNHRQDHMASLMSFNDKAIRRYWQTEMAKQFGGRPHAEDEEQIDLAGVERVCRNLHIHASPSQLLAKFYAADVTNSNRLNYAEFQTFVGFMKRRDDIRAVFLQATACPEQGMTFNEFKTFLCDIQGEDVEENLAFWESIFARFIRKSRPRDAEKQEPANVDTLRMNDVAFAAYLTSIYNLPIKPPPKEYSLERPMNEYFISSSHNTYLLGRQVAGVSSIEGYIGALVRGCRCVEVDCWDGSDGQPIVNHGRTLTTSISFEHVMTTINKYAFFGTQYPLWISLEVHCNPQQQEIMVHIIKKTFGSRLVTEPLDPSSDKLPSPSELKGRILIKVKKPHPTKEELLSFEDTDQVVGRRRGNSLTSPYIKPLAAENIAPPQSLPQSPMLSPNQFTRRLVGKSRVNTIAEGSVHDSMGSSTSDNDSGGETSQAKRSSNSTIKLLGDLGVYCMGVKFTGFDTQDAKAYNHIFSFMESSFSKNSKPKESKRALDLHNMRYLMRVYPDRTRITSNNFDPLIYWRRGVQMAALNWQTYDLGMQLNQAMFAGGTDRSGYVLKPSELREIQRLPEGWSMEKRERKTVCFTIEAVSAQQLMKPNGMQSHKTVDPYIEIEVFHANDRRDKKEMDSRLQSVEDMPLKQRTPVMPENGFNPIFQKKFQFRVTTKYPDLIFVRFAIKLSSDGQNHNDRQPVATFTGKLLNMKQGYRTLPLWDPHGEQYLFSTLFCRLQIDSIESVLLSCMDDPIDSSGRKKGISGVVFGRASTSPKSSMEKTSFDGSIT